MCSCESLPFCVGNSVTIAPNFMPYFGWQTNVVAYFQVNNFIKIMTSQEPGKDARPRSRSLASEVVRPAIRITRAAVHFWGSSIFGQSKLRIGIHGFLI